MKRAESSFARLLLAFAVAVSLMAGSAEAQTNIKSGFNLFSPEQDVEVGQQSAAQAEQQLPILRDAQVENYVNTIGQRLAGKAGGPAFQYQFRVVNSSDINAFALPGGFVYVNRGVIEQSRNEGELAGVIAHEIAHVSLRHGTHQASKAYATQAGLSILGGLLGGKVGANTANIINAVGGFGLNAVFLKFSREMESQADIRGSQILAASGYSPVDMVNFFHTLEKVDKSRKTSWLSDHPAPPDRIARIEKEAQLLNVAMHPTTNVAQLTQVQSRLRGFGAAPTAAQIAQSGQQTPTSSSSRQRPATSSKTIQVPAPSTSLRSYTNEAGIYRVSYPANWRVYEENGPAVTIAPEGGIGDVGGSNDVVYGAMIRHYDPFGAQRKSLRGSKGNVYGDSVSIQDATNDLLAQVQQGSPYLKLVRGSGQRFTMAGGTALAAVLRGTDPNTRLVERVTVVTRQLADDHLVYLVFVTPERDAKAYAPVLEAMVNSMQVNENRSH